MREGNLMVVQITEVTVTFSAHLTFDITFPDLSKKVVFHNLNAGSSALGKAGVQLVYMELRHYDIDSDRHVSN